MFDLNFLIFFPTTKEESFETKHGWFSIFISICIFSYIEIYVFVNLPFI